MANRVLRDWTFSENIEQLSYESEVFFTRLIMKADDYGKFHASEKLLKAALFPLREIKLDKITKMLQECEQIGVIRIYYVNEKPYLKINDFGQRLRIMNSKFPDPLTNDSEALTNDSTPRHERKKEVETEEKETIKAPKGGLTERENGFLIWFNGLIEKKTGKKGKFKTLSKTDKNNLKQLRESYSEELDWESAFNGMWNSKWCQETGNVTPTHLLRVDNFNKYLNGQSGGSTTAPRLTMITIADHD